MRKITAVVVTFNRKELLIRCIDYLRKQTVHLDNIIVVNNDSTDGTTEWLDSQADLDVIHQKNVGGSGGFYRGINHAYKKGYDWIWCMDDDVYPTPDCLEKLLKQNGDEVGILCPLRKQNDKVFITEIRHFNLTNPLQSLHADCITPKEVEGNDYVNVEGIAFEGPLIKREVVEKIGLPNKDLFLLYDDSDYGYRAILSGYEIRLVTQAVLNKEFFFVNDSREAQVQKGKWKLYYHIRNTVYFNRRYGKNIFVRILRPIAVLLQYEGFILKNILFNRKYTINDAIVFFQAYIDGIREHLGKKS